MEKNMIEDHKARLKNMIGEAQLLKNAIEKAILEIDKDSIFNVVINIKAKEDLKYIDVIIDIG